MHQEPHTSTLRALLVDAAGTLISPSENVAELYLEYARNYGCNLSEREVLANFRRAFNTPWTRTLLKYEGHGRPFWKFVVEQSTGCNDPELMEQLYLHYLQPSAWKLAPGALPALAAIRSSGIKLGVVSNFDTRLRPLLTAMGAAEVFDTMVISAEVGAEKPNPLIFEIACQQLGVEPEEAVHIGDDRRNDITGARSAGCHAWLWGFDVKSFEDVGEQILSFNQAAAAEH
ncbi:HAD-superfamily hydrolase [Coccomyxa subellipsoidea C-169]|uniref:HAD-superfamily hydrolase n=1 Tax=Coccomyxa subellipsoidea (strain C-169) TaxID=574566 RepID=I0YPW9_COCSC|nr:HAD-superfamily hydrolase [Coccomyxa subellipsoidea C-169]EIE20438.1 HAD-superfamily hydrolase [Coccomyxa subellipsoidea C-169]|eukprot:XP_005644982.1 HAD-superfamily hydrolase [Coccomyxa subellipsoidea C-169]